MTTLANASALGLVASLALGCGPETPAEPEPEAPGVLEYEDSYSRIYRLGRRVDIFYTPYMGAVEHHECGMLSERAYTDLEGTFAALDPAGDYGCGPADHECSPEILIHVEGFEHSPFACEFPVTIAGVERCEHLCCRPGLARAPLIYWLIINSLVGDEIPITIDGELYVAIEPDDPCE
jgi:hypothetical protein